MSKINYLLQSRLDSIKKNAANYIKGDYAKSYEIARNAQVKYRRKGWNQYDTANHYHEGQLCLESLDSFDSVSIEDIGRRAFHYSGYYADSFGCELVSAYIVRIKTKKGFFIAPAIAYSDSDMAKIYLSDGQFCSKDENSQDYYDTAYQAARWADCYAEKLADDGRECDAKFQADEQSEGLRDDNKAALKAARALIQAIRDQRAIGQIVTPICDALMAEIRSLRRSIRANNERINALKNNYWLSVE
jgi:hypothetical protein